MDKGIGGGGSRSMSFASFAVMFFKCFLLFAIVVLFFFHED